MPRRSSDCERGHGARPVERAQRCSTWRGGVPQRSLDGRLALPRGPLGTLGGPLRGERDAAQGREGPATFVAGMERSLFL